GHGSGLHHDPDLERSVVPADSGPWGSDENSHVGGATVHRPVYQRLEFDARVADAGHGAGAGRVHGVLPESYPGAHHRGPQIAGRTGGLMRVAIVGTGVMGRVHAEAWSRTGARITAFVGKPGAGGDTTLAGASGARVATELDAVLGEVDVVDVCTPTHLHAEFTLRAAAAGKHVVCEKPLALTVPDGLRMIQACRTAGVRLLVAHVLRFFPEYRLAQELVARGEIGVPAVLRLS